MKLLTLGLLLSLGLVARPVAARAAELEIVLPQNRTAFQCGEAVELAVAGLAKDQTATVTLVPQDGSDGSKASARPVSFKLTGDGSNGTSTVCARLPEYSLAPAAYAVHLDGQPTGTKFTIARGLRRSPLLVSQTIAENQLHESGANFAVSNAFAFGLLDGDGLPSEDVRRLSSGMQAQDRLIAADMPSLIYMYYTGYVLHKPWGEEKSWAAEHMTRNMRLFNFHVAQRLRRFGGNIVSVGTIDEPGLPWGQTPAGGSASGFANWDSADWYAERGWQFTMDPASRPDADWMKYMEIRCGILAEQNRRAKEDIHAVWPECVFSTDLYAPHAIMDGTDPWNQRVNDIPSTHVFLDWGSGKLGVIGGLQIEKAHDPAAHVAHAMNGQLFAPTVPQPTQRHAYHLMMNGMLAAGLQSNWWLNFRGMSPEDLRAVNEPAERIGPMLLETAHDADTALLWSFTELAMRLKDVTAKEAHKKTGEQIPLLIADLPENALTESGELNINAYSVGTNYKSQVQNMHQSLVRSGYPTHVLDERLLPQGALEDYKTLVIVGQTFALPPAVQKAIEEFVQGGGRLVVDTTTTQKFGEAVRVEADLKDVGYRWQVAFGMKDEQFPNKRAASYVQTNHYMDHFARGAIPAVREAMWKTESRPALLTKDTWLGVATRQAGDGRIIMVLNGYEELPDIPEGEAYPIYNYAPHTAEIQLQNIPEGSRVYVIEGLDWKTVRRVHFASRWQTVEFAPGEMKLYYIIPQPPRQASLDVQPGDGYLTLDASVGSQHAQYVNDDLPLPLSVTVTGPDGEEVLRVYRSTDAKGRYRERLPIGRNAPAGKYTVSLQAALETMIPAMSVTSTVEEQAIEPTVLREPVRVFDEAAIKNFLAAKPEIVIAVASDKHQAAAEELAAGLRERGVQVEIKPEKGVWRKALYPRVWDPRIPVYEPTGDEKPLGERPVKSEGTIETVGYNRHRVTRPDGQPVEGGLQPGMLLTVAGQGYVYELGGKLEAFEPGCRIYIGEGGKVEAVKGTPVETRTTEDVQAKWARPWHRIEHHVGGHHLVPQLPEAYAADAHLVLLGDGTSSELVRALQASDLLTQVVDAKYPGPGKALVSFAWSPFALEKNVILVGATDADGLSAGVDRLLSIGDRSE